MNSFVAHENYLKGKTPVITYESLHKQLWSIDDLRSQFSMNGIEKPIAEQCIQDLIEKQNMNGAEKSIDTPLIKKKEIIIETVNKEEQDGESIHSLPDIPQQSLADEWKHKQLYNDFK